jgi:hypothetical protein
VLRSIRGVRRHRRWNGRSPLRRRSAGCPGGNRTASSSPPHPTGSPTRAWSANALSRVLMGAPPSLNGARADGSARRRAASPAWWTPTALAVPWPRGDPAGCDAPLRGTAQDPVVRPAHTSKPLAAAGDNSSGRPGGTPSSVGALAPPQAALRQPYVPRGLVGVTDGRRRRLDPDNPLRTGRSSRRQ